jgi:hypothetical protein
VKARSVSHLVANPHQFPSSIMSSDFAAYILLLIIIFSSFGPSQRTVRTC